MSKEKRRNKNSNLKTILALLSYLKFYKRYIIAVLICLISSSVIVYFQPMIIQKITDFGMVGKNLKVIFDWRRGWCELCSEDIGS